MPLLPQYNPLTFIQCRPIRMSQLSTLMRQSPLRLLMLPFLRLRPLRSRVAAACNRRCQSTRSPCCRLSFPILLWVRSRAGGSSRAACSATRILPGARLAVATSAPDQEALLETDFSTFSRVSQIGSLVLGRGVHEGVVIPDLLSLHRGPLRSRRPLK